MNAALVPQGEPVVSVKDGTVFASSRDVAAHFGKRHDDVLRRIRALLKREPSLRLRIFAETSTTAQLPNGGTREDPTFDMNRDGFALLAMGFTGARALRFKLAWIEAFNRMESELLTRGDGPRVSIGRPRRPKALLPPVSDILERDNLAVMRVGGETLLVDMGRLEFGSENRVVCFDAAGELSVDTVRMSEHQNWQGRRHGFLSDGRRFGNGAEHHPGVWVIGAVVKTLPGDLAADLRNESAPKRIERAAKRYPGRFEPGSDISKDLLQVVRSARHRMQRDASLDLCRALIETIEDVIARAADPLAKTRGVVLDWDERRATEDLRGKMRAEGKEPGACRAREVMH